MTIDTTFDENDYKAAFKHAIKPILFFGILIVILIPLLFILDYYSDKNYLFSIVCSAILGVFSILLTIILAFSYRKGLKAARYGGTTKLHIVFDEAVCLEEYNKDGELVNKLTWPWDMIKSIVLIKGHLLIRTNGWLGMSSENLSYETLSELKTCACQHFPQNKLRKLKMNLDKYAKNRG